MRVPVSSTSQISNSWIRNLQFNLCRFAYTKNWLVSRSDNKKLLLGGWNSLSKKKKKTFMDIIGVCSSNVEGVYHTDLVYSL